MDRGRSNEGGKRIFSSGSGERLHICDRRIQGGRSRHLKHCIVTFSTLNTQSTSPFTHNIKKNLDGVYI